MKSERLYPIPGHEGNYSITKDGRIWSNPRPSTKGGWLKPGGSKKRYLSVILYNNAIHCIVKKKTWKEVVGH